MLWACTLSVSASSSPARASVPFSSRPRWQLPNPGIYPRALSLLLLLASLLPSHRGRHPGVDYSWELLAGSFQVRSARPPAGRRRPPARWAAAPCWPGRSSRPRTSVPQEPGLLWAAGRPHSPDGVAVPRGEPAPACSRADNRAWEETPLKFRRLCVHVKVPCCLENSKCLSLFGEKKPRSRNFVVAGPN